MQGARECEGALLGADDAPVGEDGEALSVTVRARDGAGGHVVLEVDVRLPDLRSLCRKEGEVRRAACGPIELKSRVVPLRAHVAGQTPRLLPLVDPLVSVNAKAHRDVIRAAVAESREAGTRARVAAVLCEQLLERDRKHAICDVVRIIVVAIVGLDGDEREHSEHSVPSGLGQHRA